MIPDDIVARVDKALAISVALEKMKAILFIVERLLMAEEHEKR